MTYTPDHPYTSEQDVDIDCITQEKMERLRAIAASFAHPNPLHFIYRNYRGEVSERRVLPIDISFKATEWHPEKQWVMEAYDIDKQTNRSFAMRDIQEILG